MALQAQGWVAVLETGLCRHKSESTTPALCQAFLGSQVRHTQDAAREAAERAELSRIQRMFAGAAQYIALAYALQPGREVTR